MPVPIVQILADGQSGRTVTFHGRQVVFRHSIYTRMNDAVTDLRDRIVRAVDGPVHELASSDTFIRARALTAILAWTEPHPAVRIGGQVAATFLTALSSGLCDLHHKLKGASSTSRA